MNAFTFSKRRMATRHRASTLPPPTEEEERFITDQLFRERTVDINPWVEYPSRAVQTALPLVMFYRFADWSWLLAWELFWFAAMGWRAWAGRKYGRRYPQGTLPADTRIWSFHRHGYEAMGWLAVGLASLFCFVPGSAAWEIVAVAGIGIVFTIAPFYCAERSEMVTCALAVIPIPAAALLYQQTPLHYALTALLAGMIAVLTLWGIQQVSTRRNEVRLRTALHEQIQRVEQANIAKSRFLAAASHDLRQPLHALTLFVEALKNIEHREDSRRLVACIDDSIQSLDSLFNALLDISKLDAGTVIPKHEHFSLESLLLRLDAEFGVQAHSKALAWHCDMSREVVISDPALLETVLRNLLSNAVRYTPKGSISLKVRTTTGRVEISVADTGIGIAPAEQQDVFREFHQLNNPERDRSKGLGLGLAIVHRLTQLLDISLTLHSEPGRGSCFTISVPLGATEKAVSNDAIQAIAAADPLANISILVIDDDRESREAMAALLDAWQCNTILAESAAEAVNHLQRSKCHPEIIISDFRLRDGLTGADAIADVRAAVGADVPALLVTGDTAPERLQEADTAGFLILHKPVKPQKLRTTMQFLLRSANTNRLRHQPEPTY